MAYYNQRGSRNFNYNQQRTQGYSAPQTQVVEPAPVVSIEEQIRERLQTFQLILQIAEELGISKDDLLMGQGLTAWVTSMVGNFNRK